MKKVQLLILGTTVLGISAAIKHDDVLVVDSTMLFGYEYIHSYNPQVDISLADDACQIYKPMKKMDIISDDGLVHLIPVSGILTGLLKENGTAVKLLSSVIDIFREGDKYCVKLLNKNGIETVIADRILDTTTKGVMHDGFSECSVSKSVCGMLVGDGGEDGENYSFVRGRFDKENILKLNLPAHCSFADARILLNELWQSLYEELPDTRFASCAHEFLYEFSKPVKKVVDDGWMWIPSASYGDIFTAFKEGYECDFSS